MSVPPPRESAQSLTLEAITHRIAVLRGQKVLLDSDLAALYGVETKRFPEDLMSELTADEFKALRSQFATSNATASAPTRRGGRRYLPRVFTEHGAIMAATHGDLAKRLDELENKTEALAMQPMPSAAIRAISSNRYST